jgi:hypothetical protein
LCPSLILPFHEGAAQGPTASPEKGSPGKQWVRRAVLPHGDMSRRSAEGVSGAAFSSKSSSGACGRNCRGTQRQEQIKILINGPAPCAKRRNLTQGRGCPGQSHTGERQRHIVEGPQVPYHSGCFQLLSSEKGKYWKHKCRCYPCRTPNRGGSSSPRSCGPHNSRSHIFSTFRQYSTPLYFFSTFSTNFSTELEIFWVSSVIQWGKRQYLDEHIPRRPCRSPFLATPFPREFMVSFRRTDRRECGLRFR